MMPTLSETELRRLVREPHTDRLARHGLLPGRSDAERERGRAACPTCGGSGVDTDDAGGRFTCFDCAEGDAADGPHPPVGSVVQCLKCGDLVHKSMASPVGARRWICDECDKEDA